MDFAELGVKTEIVNALNEMGITEPTLIQEKAIPLIRAGKDVIGMSKTGSGKTAAFGVPILERVVPRGGVQALIIAPTRELARQISQELHKFGKHMHLNVAIVYGGVPFDPQVDAIERAEIVVGTPGRLLDHLGQHSLDLAHTNIVVLDEADKMVEMGFFEDITAILDSAPRDKQMLLFGATISDEIENIKTRYMHSPEIAKAEEFVKEDLLSQYFYNVQPHEKFSLLMHLLKTEKTEMVIIFCSKRSTVEIVAKNLFAHGIDVEMIHGMLTQSKRQRVIDDFNTGKRKVLVASPLAARGLDIKGVSHIFNYDLAPDPQEYIHRIGRTARAGESGKAITLLSPQDYETFSDIQNHFRVEVVELGPVNFPKLRFQARSFSGGDSRSEGGRYGDRGRSGGYGDRGRGDSAFGSREGGQERGRGYGGRPTEGGPRGRGPGRDGERFEQRGERRGGFDDRHTSQNLGKGGRSEIKTGASFGRR